MSAEALRCEPRSGVGAEQKVIKKYLMPTAFSYFGEEFFTGILSLRDKPDY